MQVVQEQEQEEEVPTTISDEALLLKAKQVAKGDALRVHFAARNVCWERPTRLTHPAPPCLPGACSSADAAAIHRRCPHCCRCSGDIRERGTHGIAWVPQALGP